VKETQRKILKRVLIGLAAVIVLAVGGMTYMIGGPRNLIRRAPSRSATAPRT
jgi:hypothetical protein